MIRLRVCGTIALQRDNGAELHAVLAQPKQTAVLAYLAVTMDRGFQRRDTLLALFWPELDTERARSALSKSVHNLRRELGEGVLISRGDTELGIDSSQLWCDATAIDAAIAEGKPEEALQLYRGVMLEGFHLAHAVEFDQWLDRQRARLNDQMAQVALDLARAAATSDDHRATIQWARRASEIAPYDESALRLLITAMARNGDRAGALKTYSRFAVRLASELNAQPSPESAALERAVRAGASPASATQPRSIGDSFATDEPRTDSRSAVRSRRWPLAVAATTLFASAAAFLWFPSATPRVVAHPRTAVAVLPFENLSSGGPHAFFANGLHDEIITQLSRMSSLTPISRTSVRSYAGTRLPPLRRLASELRVGSIVEGSVQVVGERLRVNVQLIDAANDRPLWAEKYDRKLSDAFAIQSEVARQIANAVGATLSAAEQQAVASPPTTNAEAYLFYLRGLEYRDRLQTIRENLATAQQLFERAIALDSGFALAHVALANVHADMYNLRYDPSPARLQLLVREATAAVRLAPDLPEARLAMSRVWFHRDRDYVRQRNEERLALQRLPNDARIWAALATSDARLGRWDDAVVAFTKAQELDPRNPAVFYVGPAIVFMRTRRFEEAVLNLDRALALAPDLHAAAIARGQVFVLWKGELDTLRAVVNRIPDNRDVFAFGPASGVRLGLLLWERRGDSVLKVLQADRRSVYASYYNFYPSTLYAGWAHQLRGDKRAAHIAFDSALVVLDSALRELPDDWRVHAARGLALAGRGRRQEASAEARWLQQSARYRGDAVDRPSLAEESARIHAQAGEVRSALAEITRLLKPPSLLTVHALRLDPLWDPLRAEPGFKAVLTQYASQLSPVAVGRPD